jgi:hypothetical protein
MPLEFWGIYVGRNERESLHSFEQSGSWAGLIGLLFETKLDGYRAIAVIYPSGKARIWSRNHLPLEPKFRTVGEAVNRRGLCSTIFDEEIVASLGWIDDRVSLTKRLLFPTIVAAPSTTCPARG